MGLLGAKPASTPVEPNHQLAKASGSLFDNPDRYRRLIGKLIYLTLTRPELAYVVHTLAQFMHVPRHAHWDAAIRVVRYLKGSPRRGIFLSSHSPLSLTAYCDSDWATCPITRRSLTGYFISLGGSPISWKTKKQHIVSRSSAEAEYRSMAMTLCELKWLSILLRDLHVPVTHPIPLHCDNQAALHIAENPPTQCFSWGLSVDNNVHMMSAVKAEISKLNNAMDETCKIVQELKAELSRRKTTCSCQCSTSVVTEKQQPEAFEMDQLEAELETELQKLPWYTMECWGFEDRTDTFEANFSDEVSARAFHRTDDENLYSHQPDDGVLPSVLDQKLCHWLNEQQEGQIMELESKLQRIHSKLNEKEEVELQTLKDCVKRFTEFSLGNASGKNHIMFCSQGTAYQV
ncbi:hypothetical protein M9H77_23903 [Catharanthus roseus]|uniref:Uncharacterized protein n=1 Tax=Catharanthus roseus TaxID=4058 RepID=A0ACC0AWC2_CATRO|nr:hypothetical protein M9H77_23903 [Catharanthus roseus]